MLNVQGKMLRKGLIPLEMRNASVSGKVLRLRKAKSNDFLNTMKSLTGFTLIEILVVLAIIAFLASIILVRVNTTRTRARDAERVQEIRSLQNALALYYTSKNAFPIAASFTVLNGSDAVSTELLGAGSIGQIPRDPFHTAPYYQYSYRSTGGTAYELQYSLETDAILGKDGAEGATNGNPQTATP